jgi:hypothetical protein
MRRVLRKVGIDPDEVYADSSIRDLEGEKQGKMSYNYLLSVYLRKNVRIGAVQKLCYRLLNIERRI